MKQLHRGTMGVGGALHDPLVIASIIDPSIIKTKPVTLTIETSGECMKGATIADYWNPNNTHSNVYVALEVDSNKFFNMLYDINKGNKKRGL